MGTNGTNERGNIGVLTGKKRFYILQTLLSHRFDSLAISRQYLNPFQPIQRSPQGDLDPQTCLSRRILTVLGNDNKSYHDGNYQVLTQMNSGFICIFKRGIALAPQQEVRAHQWADRAPEISRHHSLADL